MEELDVTEIADHQCPEFIRTDDTLLTIEMTIVRPPFIVDFVSAYTDEELDRLDFTDDVKANAKRFGKSDSASDGRR